MNGPGIALCLILAGLFATATAAAGPGPGGVVPPTRDEDGGLVWEVPLKYRLVGASAFVFVGVAVLNLIFEWMAGLITWVFGWGRGFGGQGRDLAPRLLAAAGVEGVRVGETFHNSSYRKLEGETDYRPKAALIELTADKATGASAASAGLVAIEVGRALQHRAAFPPFAFEQRLGPVAAVCGHVWIFAFFGAAVVGSIFRTGWSTPVADGFWALGGFLVGLLFLFAATRSLLELDAARRGFAALRATGALTARQTAVVRTFLIILIGLALAGLTFAALNVFRVLPRGAKG